MALSQVLELTSGPAVVPQLGFSSPLTATVNLMRCQVPVTAQVATAGVATALPAGAVLYKGIKQPGAIKGDWLANCQLTPSSDPASPGLWTGTLQLNTPEMRTAMHADPTDPAAELLVLPCLAEYYYTLPGQTDPVCALNYNFSVNAPLYNGTESIAPTANISYPPPDQVPTKGAVLAVVQKGAGVWPARPLGYGAVVYVGASPAPTDMQSGDIWQQTDGATVGGSGGGSGSSGSSQAGATVVPTLITVATNADKLALPSTTPAGTDCLISDEAGRLEKYPGDDITQDASWIVTRNTILATFQNNSGADFNVDSVKCPNGSSTSLWIDPSNFQVESGDYELCVQTLFSNSGNYFYDVSGANPFDAGNAGIFIAIGGGTGASSLLYQFAPRDSVTIVVILGQD